VLLEIVELLKEAVKAGSETFLCQQSARPLPFQSSISSTLPPVSTATCRLAISAPLSSLENHLTTSTHSGGNFSSSQINNLAYSPAQQPRPSTSNHLTPSTVQPRPSSSKQLSSTSYTDSTSPSGAAVLPPACVLPGTLNENTSTEFHDKLKVHAILFFS